MFPVFGLMEISYKTVCTT